MLDKIRQKLADKRYRLILSIAIFAVIGTIFILITRAQTPAIHVEPETGNLSGNVGINNNPNASGGGYVIFGQSPNNRPPYDPASPWNTPIGNNPQIHPNSDVFINAIADNNRPLSSDPDQYAIPIYQVDSNTPKVSVKLSGFFSAYDNGDNSRVGHGTAPTINNVPIPADAVQSPGTDGQIIFYDAVNQVEWGFWQWSKNGSTYRATNGYRYKTSTGHMGRFVDGLAGRGAGTPYLSGLVRKWELDSGTISHAISFAYQYPSKEFVYPASKSDGDGVTGIDLPEGAQLQLNPNLTEADFNRWGLNTEAKTIARALQKYGMYVIDRSGSSKIYLEDRMTAGWPAHVNRDMMAGIPWDEFRVINF